MPQTAAAKKNETMRERLREAALSLYKEGGIKAVTFRRLAAELEISHMLPYRYFENKDDLLACLRQDCFIRLMRHIESSDPTEKGPLPRLYAISLAIFSYIVERPDEYKLMFSLNQPPLERYPDLLEVRLDLFDYLLAIVQKAIDAGLVEGDAHTVLHLAWATAHGLFTLHVSGQLVHTRDLDSLLEPAIETLFAPFRLQPGEIEQLTR